MVLSHRLQLLLDEDRYARVADLARRRHTSVAAVIREAIDRRLGVTEDRRAAAGRRVLDAEPMDVPDVAELLEELYRVAIEARMVVLDTTVLLYGVGAEHPYRAPCRRLVDTVRLGFREATTTVEVVQEFAHVRARRRGRDDAHGLATDYVALLGPLLTAGESQLVAGLGLWRRHEGLGCFDAILAATALDIGATALVSADTDFRLVRGLHHVVPDEAGIAELLS